MVRSDSNEMSVILRRFALAALLINGSGCGSGGGSDGSDAGVTTLPQQHGARALVTVDGVAVVADYALNEKSELSRLELLPTTEADLYSQTCSGDFSESYSCSQATGVQLTVTRGNRNLPVEMLWTDPRNPETSFYPVGYRRNWNRSGDAGASLLTLTGDLSYGFSHACLRPFATLQRNSGRLESIASVVSQGSVCTMSTIPLPFSSNYSITYGTDALPIRVNVADSSVIFRPRVRSFYWKYEAGKLSSIVMLKFDSTGAPMAPSIERSWRYDNRGNVIEFRRLSRNLDGSVAEQFVASWQITYDGTGPAIRQEELLTTGKLEGKDQPVGAIAALEYSGQALPIRPCLSPRAPDPANEEDIAYLLLEQMTLVEARTLPGCPAALPWLPY